MTRFLHPEEAYDNRMLALGWIKSLLLQLGKNGLEMDGINDVLEGCVFLIIENMGKLSEGGCYIVMNISTP